VHLRGAPAHGGDGRRQVGPIGGGRRKTGHRRGEWAVWLSFEGAQGGWGWRLGLGYGGGGGGTRGERTGAGGALVGGCGAGCGGGVGRWCWSWRHGRPEIAQRTPLTVFSPKYCAAGRSASRPRSLLGRSGSKTRTAICKAMKSTSPIGWPKIWASPSTGLKPTPPAASRCWKPSRPTSRSHRLHQPLNG